MPLIVPNRHEILTKALEKSELAAQVAEPAANTPPTGPSGPVGPAPIREVAAAQKGSPSPAEPVAAAPASPAPAEHAPERAVPSLAEHSAESPSGPEGEADAPLFDWKELEGADERTVRLAKQLQGAFTKRTQQLAEERKTLAAAQEHLPPEAKAFQEKLSVAFQIDPTGNLAGQLIMNAAAAMQPAERSSGPLSPGQAPQQPANEPPPAQYDPYGYPIQDPAQDPRYQAVQQELQREKAERQKLEQLRQLEILERQAHTEFDKLEQRHGITIPKHERELTAIWSMQQNFPNPWTAWEFSNQEKIRTAQIAKAREEAVSLTTQKLAMAPGPSGVPSRVAPSEDAPPKGAGRRAIIQHAYDRLAKS